MPTVKMEKREGRTRNTHTGMCGYRQPAVEGVGMEKQIQIRTSRLESQERGSAAVWSLGQAQSPKEKTRPEDKGTCLTAKFNP